MTERMIYAIKAEVADPASKTYTFEAQKTMYGGKRVATGDTIFVFASENEGGQGLVARGVVTMAQPGPRKLERSGRVPWRVLLARIAVDASTHGGSQ